MLLSQNRKGKKIERKQMVSLAGGTNKQTLVFCFQVGKVKLTIPLDSPVATSSSTENEHVLL